MTETILATAKPSGVERLKLASRGLRGDLAEQLAAGGTQVTEDGYNLLKFHGTYEQHDRDSATERKQQGLEKAYSFMVRVRIPGGALTASQYLALDALADRYANATLRVTTRQAIQFHGVLKGDLRAHIAAINHTLLTTQCACGDVVRNVITSPAPRRTPRHQRLLADAHALSTALLPASRAYHELFLDAEAQADLGAAAEEEPLYGAAYLPRKFKIALGLPEDNTADVLANDFAAIALYEANRLVGYNIAVGGGLGMTHNKAATYPRLASLVGFVGPDQLIAVAKAAIALHRDHGNRVDRRRARLKYVVEDNGVEWVRARLSEHLGFALAPPRLMPHLAMPELLGWHAQGDGLFWLGVPLPSGRIADSGEIRLRSALRLIVERFGADPVLTPQQDLLLSNLAPGTRSEIESILRAHGVALAEQLTPLARWALACPALPTCGLALTEAERVRAPMVASIDAALARQGLAGERISLRITGCPNGCARPYSGDIGVVGRMPGFYALYVGGDFEGTVLSFKLLDKVAEDQIAATLEPLFAAFAALRHPGEAFGAFCQRQGVERLVGLISSGRVAA